MSDIFRRHEGWFCCVAGKTFGPWPDKGSAAAGLETEQRRAAERALGDLPLITMEDGLRIRSGRPTPISGEDGDDNTRTE